MDYDDFPEVPEDYFEPSAPDHYFLQAQQEIRALYENDRDIVFYIRQLQVKFEKKYYHWITNNATIGLFKLGYLKDLRIPKEKGTSTRFFIHRSFLLIGRGGPWSDRRIAPLAGLMRTAARISLT